MSDFEVLKSDQMKRVWAEQGVTGLPDAVAVADGAFNADETGYNPAPAGEYVLQVADWGFGNELKLMNWKDAGSFACYSLVVDFVVAEGPYAGRTARDFLPFPNGPDQYNGVSNKIHGKYASRLGHFLKRVMGWQGDDKRLSGNRLWVQGFDLDQMKGRKVRATIEIGQNDKPSIRWFSYAYADGKAGQTLTGKGGKSSGGSPRETESAKAAASEVEV